jgi:hypothetical protein
MRTFQAVSGLSKSSEAIGSPVSEGKVHGRCAITHAARLPRKFRLDANRK